MTGLRFFLFFAIMLVATAAVLGVLEVFNWDDLANYGGKMLLALVVVFAAGSLISKLGPQKNKTDQSGSHQQGPRF